MSGVDKASILATVASSPVPRRAMLRELGVPKSTYYRWLKRLRLDDRPGGNPKPWNRLTPKEQRAVLVATRELPELPSTGCVDHRQPGIQRLRVHCLPHPA